MNTIPASVPVTDWQASFLALTGLLVRRRDDLGVSQEALAIQLGLARRTLQRWEHGDADVPAMRLFQWAAALGVRIAPDVAHSNAGEAA